MQLKNYEEQYLKICNDILQHGYYAQNRTGIPTYKIPHQIMHVDLSEEFPILQTKKVAFKTATKEMLWIYQKQSNVVQDLRDQGVKIWDEWEGEDGTIGKAYGYQIKKFNQIGNLIKTLKENPQDRRMMLNLWNWQDLPEMKLAPCCFLTMYDVTDGRLNCMLIQRSGDMALGVPFNTTQFAVLTLMLAQVTGLKPGILTHVIDNAHIYENQIQGMKEQLARAEHIHTLSESHSDFVKDKELMDKLKVKPVLSLNKEIKDFYDFTIDDIVLNDYNHLDKITMPVSV